MNQGYVTICHIITINLIQGEKGFVWKWVLQTESKTFSEWSHKIKERKMKTEHLFCSQLTVLTTFVKLLEIASVDLVRDRLKHLYHTLLSFRRCWVSDTSEKCRHLINRLSWKLLIISTQLSHTANVFWDFAGCWSVPGAAKVWHACHFWYANK